MSSILDHVEQAVPRATVYGAMKGSPVFIGKYFREVNPSSNATNYNYSNGDRRISFVIASPDKTVFNDMRSCYLRCNIQPVDVGGVAGQNTGLAEPASNIIERIVIKMNGTVVEDISRLDHLTSFFKRSLLTREQKNAREREGWAHYAQGDADTADPQAQNGNGCLVPAPRGSSGVRATGNGRYISGLCLKLDMSGIMNVQQLLSGYYSPLEIDLYLQAPETCGVAYVDAAADNALANYVVQRPRLCIEQVVMSPEYVSAFEAALLANSSAQGIQIPFTTYYTYETDLNGTDVTFWVRKPVRYLKGVYWAALQNGQKVLANSDSYRFKRQRSNDENTAVNAVSADQIQQWQVSIGTKSYRQIDDETAEAADFNCNESQVMFAKAVGHYNDYSVESSECTNGLQKTIRCQVQGIDLEFSPDNDVLASETTLNSNDVRLRIKQATHAAARQYKCMVFMQYQSSIAFIPR